MSASEAELYAARLREVMRINKDNAADFEPPNLRNFAKAESRGPDSLPGLWYEKMAGTTWAAAVEVEQKKDSALYTLQKKIWDGTDQMGGWAATNAALSSDRPATRKRRFVERSLELDPVAPRNMLDAFVSRRAVQ